MTADLDALARTVSTGTAGQYPRATYPLLAPAARLLAAHAWRRDVLCQMCPRYGHAHTCSCPHHQARKRLRAFGVWPEGACL